MDQTPSTPLPSKSPQYSDCLSNGSPGEHGGQQTVGPSGLSQMDSYFLVLCLVLSGPRSMAGSVHSLKLTSDEGNQI